MVDMPWRSLRAASSLLVRHRLDLTVGGLDNLPPSGPVIIAARHFHHLYDGCVLLVTVPRPLSILVALDWVEQPVGKRAMTGLCRAADWPIIARRGRMPSDGIVARQLRSATRASLDVLAAGRVLVVFPEGYPNVDPGYTPKTDHVTFLPFEPGFIRLAAIAASQNLTVPIVPAGIAYQQGDRWRVHLEFGHADRVHGRADEGPALRRIEASVRRLSEPPDQWSTATAT